VRGKRRWFGAAGICLLLAAATHPAEARPRTLEGVPRLEHVFVIVLENEDFSTTFAPNSPATYLNGLAATGVFARQYYGVSHVSADNYIAMTSGGRPSPLFQSDCVNWLACETYEAALPSGGRSLPDQLQEHGLTWGAYMDSMARPCQHPAVTDLRDPYQNGYATRHDPFVYYPPIVGSAVADSQRCIDHVRPYTELLPMLQRGRNVPNYVFIAPDTCDDGHDTPCTAGGTDAARAAGGGLASADAWLRANVPLILASPAYKDHGALFITFDEASNSDLSGCCASGVLGNGTDGGGHVGLVLLSPSAGGPRVVDTPYDHFSLLRTIEDSFGIDEHLDMAASPNEHAMADLFGGTR